MLHACATAGAGIHSMARALMEGADLKLLDLDRAPCAPYVLYGDK